MDTRNCRQCGKFPGCHVGRTRAREGRTPCAGWVEERFERDTGTRVMSGREFFERYGIPTAVEDGGNR